MLPELYHIIDSLQFIDSLQNCRSGYYSRKGPSSSVDCTSLHFSAQLAAIILRTATMALGVRSGYEISQGNWKEKVGHQLVIKKSSNRENVPNFLGELKKSVRIIFETLSKDWAESNTEEALRYKNDWAKSMDEPEKLVVFSRERPQYLEDADLVLTHLVKNLWQSTTKKQKVYVTITRGNEILIVGKREHLNELISAIRAEALLT